MGGVRSAGRRWLAVTLGLAVFVAVAVVVRSWPAADDDVDAATLADRVQDSVDRPWSGYVVSQGTLALPDADRFSSVGDLLGEQTRLRAWWRGPDAWRVDELRPAGEVGLRHEGALTTEWSYETGIAEGTAERYRDPDVRLPRTVDLLPPELARHVLAGVRDDEVSRIGARRLAGRDALGLRLVPSLPQASVRRVDVWADAETSVPLSVEVYGDGDDPVLSTAFAEFDDTEPAASTVAFDPPRGVVVEDEDVLDIVDAVSRFAEAVPPRRLAGLPRTRDSAGAVGVYGRGVTRVMALPLDERGAGPLREQLALTPGASVTPERTVAVLGPLGVLVTDDGDGDGWLVTGLVTPETLVRAGRSLTPSWAFTTTAAPMTTTGGTP
ncbi:hypothetical protein [Nocardioides sp. CFH 31398]|uniref:hypothetical protein n=1 Tax=Nocardioides sp. CFH 31398 TaxID=2919579 RepID=UPI001F069119|nr:hypothetical protein [Nocardioides sp. CFH 31398]MCH1868249.1 hypothetical protein [Nocardioides sp. CFH 31398]